MTGPINIRSVKYAHTAFLALQSQIIDAVAHEAGEFGARYQGHHWKKPTGNLEGSTETQVVRTRTGNRLVIRNKAKYALAQEFGSGIHATRGPRAKYPIVARRAKALRFVVNGHVVFRKRVMHPGVKPTRFLFQKTEAAGAHEWNLLRSGLGRLALKFSRHRY